MVRGGGGHRQVTLSKILFAYLDDRYRLLLDLLLFNLPIHHGLYNKVILDQFKIFEFIYFLDAGISIINPFSPNYLGPFAPFLPGTSIISVCHTSSIVGLSRLRNREVFITDVRVTNFMPRY